MSEFDDYLSLDAKFDAWQRTKDPRVMSSMMNDLKPVIDTAVTSYASRPSPTVRGQAQVLTARAIKSFNPKKGANLRTHVMNQLQPLRRYSTQATQGVRVGEQRKAQYAQLREAEEQFYRDRGRDPSVAELADKLRISPARVQRLRRGDLYQVTEGSHLGLDSDRDVTEIGQDENGPMTAWIDYVYLDQDPTNQKIMEWKLGLYGSKQLSNQEISRRLKITPAAVTQRAARLAGLIEQGAGMQ